MGFGYHNIENLCVALSPMDGVTDNAYRQIVKKYGKADLLYTEFVNVHGLALGIERLFETLHYTSFQRPILAQIYGHEAEYFFRAALICFLLGFDGVDINMGCPAKKISDRGAGAGLICYPQNAAEMIKETKRARIFFQEKMNQYHGIITDVLNDTEIAGVLTQKVMTKIIEFRELCKVDDSNLSQSRLTVSVKTRIGYDQPTLNEWLPVICNEMPDFVAIHGRTLKQMYSGIANWEIIAVGINECRKIERYSSIKFLANGDIKSVENSKECLDITKADGLLIGRGSYGYPELLQKIKLELSGEEYKEIVTKFELMIEHSRFHETLTSEPYFGMRKNLAWYSSGLANAVELRKKLVLCNSTEEVINIINEYD